MKTSWFEAEQAIINTVRVDDRLFPSNFHWSVKAFVSSSKADSSGTLYWLAWRASRVATLDARQASGKAHG